MELLLHTYLRARPIAKRAMLGPCSTLAFRHYYRREEKFVVADSHMTARKYAILHCWGL